MATQGSKLTQLRKSAGLTLEQLAERVGTTKSQIQRMEKGTRPLLDTWKKRLAPHLGVEPWQLAEGAPERIPDDEFMQIMAKVEDATLKAEIKDLVLKRLLKK